MSGGYDIRPDLLGAGTPAELLAGFVKSFVSETALKAFASAGIDDGSTVRLINGNITLLLTKITDAAAVDNAPLTIVPDDEASTDTAYVLTGAFITGYPASFNPDTGDFHLINVSGSGGAGDPVELGHASSGQTYVSN